MHVRTSEKTLDLWLFTKTFAFKMASTSHGVPTAANQQNKQPSQDFLTSTDEAGAKENEIASEHPSGECVGSLTSGTTLAPNRKGHSRGTIGTTIAPSSKTKIGLAVLGCLLLAVSWTFGQNQSDVPKPAKTSALLTTSSRRCGASP